MQASTIQARMKNPAMVVPGAMKAIQDLYKATSKGGVPQQTLELVHLRASQINGCSACVDSGARSAKKAGETDERLFAVAAWREAPYFTDAERVALALAEAVTRLSDRADAVADEIWEEAARHYDEQQLAALILWIATTNLFNRLNVTIREPAGATWG
jgi:AhpD family alkylhydroperoxidase